MPVDLNALPIEVADVPMVDFDNYVDPTDFPPPIPELPQPYKFKTTKVEIEKFSDGIVSFIMDHEAYNPITGELAGVINFDRISTKVFNRGNPPVPASMAADMLRACGITERPRSPREWGEQITSIKSWCDQGNTWHGVVRWEGYCSHKDTQYETQVDGNKKPLEKQQEPHKAPVNLQGMAKWRVGQANGTEPHYNATTPCPVCKQDIQARAKISRRVPASPR